MSYVDFTCLGNVEPNVTLSGGGAAEITTGTEFVFTGFTTADAGNIGGKFQNATHATGTIPYAGRDNCSYEPRWSARRVATDVLGPFNFGQ